LPPFLYLTTKTLLVRPFPF